MVAAATGASLPLIGMSWRGMGDSSRLGYVSFLVKDPYLLGGIFLEWGFVLGDLLCDVSNRIHIVLILHLYY